MISGSENIAKSAKEFTHTELVATILQTGTDWTNIIKNIFSYNCKLEQTLKLWLNWH